MISDPLTLELGEIGQSAGQVGFASGRIHGSFSGFNCDVDEVSDDSTEQMTCFNASFGVAEAEVEDGAFNYAIEASYLSSLTDTDGMEGFMEENELTLREHVGAYGLFGKMSLGAFSLIGEVVAGTGNLKFEEETRDRPLTWNSELAYLFNILDKDAIFAFGLQGSDNLEGFLPERRFIASFGLGISPGVTTALEYAHERDYSESRGGTGNNANAVTAQVALEF